MSTKIQILIAIIIGLTFLASSCQAHPELNPGIKATPLSDTAAPNPEFTPTLMTQVQDSTKTTNNLQVTPAPGTEGLPMPIMGVEVKRINNPKIVEMFAENGGTAIRHNALNWSIVEPNEGERRWEDVKELEKGLTYASQAGLDVILIVKSTPPWAQKVPGYFCGPISQEKLQSFAVFMKDLVSRYSAPPYNVKYWEIGNEPDVSPKLVQPKSVFGCWGDDLDSYYGGGYYAEMLKAAYPSIKSADPEAQVLIGGLLLDCDPSHPPQGKDCKPARFLEGILDNGGGDYFDIVSYHGYAPYSGADKGGGLYNDEHFPPWEPRGGVVLGKVDFLREVLSKYGYDKPIFDTEGSLTCPESSSNECNPPGDAFFEAQADYVVWLFLRNWAENVKGTIWYQFEGPGWRYGSMLDKQGEPKPAFNAFHFLTEELGEAKYIQKVTDYPPLQGYEFQSDETTIWVLWSPDGQAHPITLPSSITKIKDIYGNELPLTQGEINVLRPVYLELSP